ncbi:UDP-N-acetylmuramate dehydrogenase [Aestuariivivens sediminicola]|uniref:UDP-N-acetylmuramate dehydrogenase n=1 Tax=Aestuariivivens sediminicola TaxID=2913560 RepID=UPI001F594998
MQIHQNISLKPYNTFGIDVKAKHFVSASSVNDLKDILNLKEYPNKLILGGGSNLLLTKDQDALIIHINLKGIKTISEGDNHVLVCANAGENWHDFVLWCLERGFGGVENLSLIPGKVGAAPIQNIGAYGVELKDVFVSCDALSIETNTLKSFDRDDCNFGYRSSIFKTHAKGKYIITSVTFRLSKKHHELHTDYGAIASRLDKMDIKEPSISAVSNAVIAIRKSKLPDPRDIGNSGSFFKNPVITKTHCERLLRAFKDMPHYPLSDDQVKIPAGWLIEQAGFKGKHFGSYGVHKNQALVLVNYGGAKGEDLFRLSKLIQKTIKRLYGISLEAEVNIL